MRVEGTHTFAATKAMVWSLLHDPAVISRAIPGCETFYQLTRSEYLGSLKINDGPFSGEYKGNLHLSDRKDEESCSLKLEGSGPEGSIWAEGHITLIEENRKTTLSYEGQIMAGGSTVSQSPRLLRTTSNALIRQFFAEIDRYIQIQTGTYTTQTPDRPPSTSQAAKIDMRERIQELQQNRRTTTIVILILILASFMTIGAAVVAILLIRFGLRLFRQYVKNVVQEEKQNQPSESADRT